MNINQVRSGMSATGMKPTEKPSTTKIEEQDSQEMKAPKTQGQDGFVKSEAMGETGFYTRTSGAAASTASTASVMAMSISEDDTAVDDTVVDTTTDADDTVVGGTTDTDADDTVVGGTTDTDADDTVVGGTTDTDADDTVVGDTTDTDADDTVVGGTTDTVVDEDTATADAEADELRALADKILEMHQNSQISNFSNMLSSMIKEDDLSIAYTSGTDMMLASAGVFNGTFTTSSLTSTATGSSTTTSTYSVEAVSDQTVNWALDLVMNDPDQLDAMKDMIVENYKNIGVNIDSNGDLVGGLNGDAGDKYEETIAALDYAAANGTMDGFTY